MFAEQIAKGVALLDAKMPGWLDKLDLSTLDIDSCRRCVLGQLAGRTATARVMAQRLGLGRDELSPECKAHGFDNGVWPDDGPIERCIDDYRALTAEWKATILKLRADRLALPVPRDTGDAGETR